MSGRWKIRKEFPIKNLPLPIEHILGKSLTALNNGLIAFPETQLLASRDHELVSTVANRVVEIATDGVIDRVMGFEEYLEAG